MGHSRETLCEIIALDYIVYRYAKTKDRQHILIFWNRPRKATMFYYPYIKLCPPDFDKTAVAHIICYTFSED
jgi:hypothetical protein